VQLEALLEALLVPIERVRVLHDELTDADETGSRPRLVPVLRLEVVEHLREIAIRLDLARVERDGLLVRQREDELAIVAITELEELGDVVAVGRLPELGRGQDGHRELLRPDRVHLFANDLNDVLVNAPAERKKRPQPRAQLADEGAADEQLVADRLGVGRGLAQGRQEELGRSADHAPNPSREEFRRLPPWRARPASPS
jgi:hypothetical protein